MDISRRDQEINRQIANIRGERESLRYQLANMKPVRIAQDNRMVEYPVWSSQQKRKRADFQRKLQELDQAETALYGI